MKRYKGRRREGDESEKLEMLSKNFCVHCEGW